MILVANSNADPFNQALVDALGPSLAQPLPLPYGDAVFTGLWTGSRSIRVLIERKRVLEFIQCVMSGRHLKQAQDAAEAGFEFQYLIVEGYFSADSNGMVILPRGKQWLRLSQVPTSTGQIPDLEYRRLDDYLNQIDLYAGIRSMVTRGVKDTARQIENLYLLFQRPPEEHHTLRNLWQQTANAPPESGFLVPPTLLERVAMQLPKVGWERSRAIADEFETLQNLCGVIATEDVKALQKVYGVGRGIAKGIIDAAKTKEV